MYREQIEQYIDAHKEEMLADIIELCKIDSAKGPYEEGKPFGEGPFQALAKGLEIGEKHGFAITNYDNYVGTIDLNDKEKQLDILAHLDIVPGGEGWTVTTPFEPVIKDGKIYGRGTSDDKGPAMTALYAMKAIKELGIPVKKNVRLILGTDEECGSS
ncbi:MAG: M20/M25/M40 family metallo-hydrolase, partial [Lachnospiraceae bacterium]|nr:M20/M25/M40 family metallo-hydrolase [Lachnospiraceae bacterium]